MNPLRMLLDLPPAEKQERGLEHTPREIFQQPETWRNTYQRSRERLTDLKALLRGTVPDSGRTVYLIGAGTSDYAGRALAPLLRQQWKCDAWALPSTSVLTDFDDFHRSGREYLWISFSRSGDSPEGVALLQRVLEQHPSIRQVVITCNQNGQMAQLCARHPDRSLALVLDDAVNDRGLAMTSSFSNMLLAGQCLAHFEDLDSFGNTVAQMSEIGSAVSAGCSRGGRRDHDAGMSARMFRRIGRAARRSRRIGIEGGRT